MKQVILAIIIFFGLSVHAQIEKHTLQGALSLLEKAQNDISVYEQQDPRLYIWFCALRDSIVKLFQPITNNKLANQYDIFGSVPGVILIAGLIPMLLLVVFSYAMFKFIIYEPKKMEFKYAKLPMKENQKAQNNNHHEYPSFSIFNIFEFI